MATNLQTAATHDPVAQKQAAFNAAFDALARQKFSDKALAAQVIALFGEINATRMTAANRIQ